MAVTLASPPRIKQKGNQCWAAAAASWSAVTPSVQTRTAKDLIDLGKEHKVVSSSGALKGEDGIEWLKRELGLRHERGDAMTVPHTLEPKLDRSHVIFMYRKSSWTNSVHAVVVWGVDDEMVYFMDPQSGKWTFPDWSLFDFSWELCLWKA